MNASFKKFRLVEEDEFRQRERQKVVRDYNPEVMSEARKQDSVSQALETERLTPELKLLMLRLLQRSLKPSNQTIIPKPQPKQVTISFSQPGFKTEIPVTPIIPAQPVGAAANPAQDPHAGVGRVDDADEDADVFHDVAQPAIEPTIPISEVINKLAPTYKEKSGQIGQIIDKNPNVIKVADNFEVIINGERITNSNAVDLFRFLSNPGNISDYPVGTVKFVNALVTLKVPYQLISNKTVRSHLQNAYQSGKGKGLSNIIGFAKRPPLQSSFTLSKKRAHILPKSSFPTKGNPRKRTQNLINTSALSNLKLYKI